MFFDTDRYLSILRLLLSKSSSTFRGALCIMFYVCIIYPRINWLVEMWNTFYPLTVEVEGENVSSLPSSWTLWGHIIKISTGAVNPKMALSSPSWYWSSKSLVICLNGSGITHLFIIHYWLNARCFPFFPILLVSYVWNFRCSSSVQFLW